MVTGQTIKGITDINEQEDHWIGFIREAKMCIKGLKKEDYVMLAILCGTELFHCWRTILEKLIKSCAQFFNPRLD